MFGNNYTHFQVTAEQAEALSEIAVIDALRVGMIAAQIRASQNRLDPDRLARFDTFLANRHRSLARTIEGAGLIYQISAGGVLAPVFVAAQRIG